MQVRNVIIRALQQSQIDKGAAGGAPAAAARAAQVAVECVFEHCLQARTLSACSIAAAHPVVDMSFIEQSTLDL